MFKSALQAAPRRIASCKTILPRCSARRSLSTAPPSHKSRSWKSSAARWALAGAGVYYYNTSSVFAEEPEAAIQRLDESIHHIQESKQPTVDALVEEKRRRQAQTAAEEEQKARVVEGNATDDDEGEEGGLEGLEDEAGQQGAFNPETGEINWDCPCLGGMAHGPCGEEFQAAFSCFVYSTEEPKGVECIEKFKGMQDCFRLHPEMYGSELEDDEDELEDEIRARESAAAAGDEPSKPTREPTSQVSDESATPLPTEEKKSALVQPPKAKGEPQNDGSKTSQRQTSESSEEADELLPKSAYDATQSK